MLTEATFAADSFLDVKSDLTVSEDGTLIIEGMASDWGMDDQDELFTPGAFQKGIDNFLSTNPVLLYHHDGGKALGRVTALTETPDGLHMKAEIDPPAAGSWAEDVYQKIKRGTIRGLSVSGRFRRRLSASGIPQIYEAGLREISVTPLPVNPRTMFAVAQKAFADADDAAAEGPNTGAQETLRKLEAVLGTLETL